MSLLAFYEIHLAAIAEQLALWGEFQADRDGAHYSGKLLHCTQLSEDGADPRYWTVYDHFIVRMDARMQARRQAYRRVLRFLGRLAGRWARMVRGRPAARPQRAAA